MLYQDYDPFQFMIVVLFVIFMLIIFIVIIVYNILSRPDNMYLTLYNDTPITTKCIPKPTPLPANH